MIAGSNLRDDATVRFMRGVLRRDFAGEQIAPAQDRDRGFVTGGFQREDGAHTEGVMLHALPSGSSRSRLGNGARFLLSNS